MSEDKRGTELATCPEVLEGEIVEPSEEPISFSQDFAEHDVSAAFWDDMAAKGFACPDSGRFSIGFSGPGSGGPEPFTQQYHLPPGQGDQL